MLFLSDSVTCRKDFIIRLGICISASEHCRKMKFRTYLHLTQIGKIYLFVTVSDFVTCTTSLYIWRRRSKAHF